VLKGKNNRRVLAYYGVHILVSQRQFEGVKGGGGGGGDFKFGTICVGI
jgi:hypothetical protein